MKLELDVDRKMEHVLECLRGTAQWGDTHSEVATRLMQQRVWQLCGDALDTSKIGVESAKPAANQITKPQPKPL